MPRALLIHPWIHDFAAYDFWARPLSLLTLAASLREAGWDVELVDLTNPFYKDRVKPLPERNGDGSGKMDQEFIVKPPALRMIPRRFKRYGMSPEAFRAIASRLDRPDVILVGSVMTYWWTGVRETIEEARAVFPKAPVILGGVYASLMPEHARAKAGADFVAAGDYAESLPPLLMKIGLPSKLGSEWPFPAWDLLPEIHGAAVLTGRGCPLRCAYCAVHKLHPARSRRGAGEVVEEIRRLAADFIVTDVAFYDDALRAGGDDHLVAILEGVIDAGLALRFHAINALHLRGFSRELGALLRRANFTTLRFGLETVSRERAKMIGDKAGRDDLIKAAAHLHEAGYSEREIGVYLLAGLPGQSIAEIEQGIDAVLDAGARPYLSEFSPVPGSPLWDEAAKAARFDIAAEPLYHNNSLLPCAEPEITEQVMSRLKKITRTKK